MRYISINHSLRNSLFFGIDLLPAMQKLRLEREKRRERKDNYYAQQTQNMLYNMEVTRNITLLTSMLI